MDAPLITIGITCYREGEWLRECWNSVLDQSDKHWTAILIMDGEADEATRLVYEEIEHENLRKFSFQTNRGPYPSRNATFGLTTTPYHLYLDADDQLCPDSIAILLDALGRFPSADIVYGDYELFGAEARIQKHPHSFNGMDLAFGQCISGPALYRVQLWEALGGFWNELSRGNADYDFILGAYERKALMIHCGKVFYRYRMGHAGKISSSYRLQYHKTHQLMAERHRCLFSDPAIRKRFLAQGYRRSAVANYAAHNILVGVYFHAKMIACGVGIDKAAVDKLLESSLSPMLYRWFRRILRSWMPAKKT